MINEEPVDVYGHMTPGGNKEVLEQRDDAPARTRQEKRPSRKS
jgi:hypothetical protein